MISRLVVHSHPAVLARLCVALTVLAFTLGAPARFAHAEAPSGNANIPVKIVAFGDSLIAGYGLDAGDGFPDQLEAALRKRGHAVEIINAGVSGDTIEAAANRLDWALGEGADGVIVVLGGNDFLRGLNPDRSRRALDGLLGTLAQRNLPTLLGGMRAPLNLDPAYRGAFDAMYPELASQHGAMLYPFFLDGVAMVGALNQSDGIHPNEDGVAIIVAQILPAVEAFLEKVRAEKAES